MCIQARYNVWAYKRVLESVLTQFLKDLGTAERDANPIIFVPDTRPDEE